MAQAGRNRHVAAETRNATIAVVREAEVWRVSVVVSEEAADIESDISITHTAYTDIAINFFDDYRN